MNESAVTSLPLLLRHLQSDLLPVLQKPIPDDPLYIIDAVLNILLLSPSPVEANKMEQCTIAFTQLWLPYRDSYPAVHILNRLYNTHQSFSESAESRRIWSLLLVCMRYLREEDWRNAGRWCEGIVCGLLKKSEASDEFISSVNLLCSRITSVSLEFAAELLMFGVHHFDGVAGAYAVKTAEESLLHIFEAISDNDAALQARADFIVHYMADFTGYQPRFIRKQSMASFLQNSALDKLRFGLGSIYDASKNKRPIDAGVLTYLNEHVTKGWARGERRAGECITRHPEVLNALIKGCTKDVDFATNMVAYWLSAAKSDTLAADCKEIINDNAGRLYDLIKEILKNLQNPTLYKSKPGNSTTLVNLNRMLREIIKLPIYIADGTMHSQYKSLLSKTLYCFNKLLWAEAISPESWKTLSLALGDLPTTTVTAAARKSMTQADCNTAINTIISTIDRVNIEGTHEQFCTETFQKFCQSLNYITFIAAFNPPIKKQLEGHRTFANKISSLINYFFSGESSVCNPALAEWYAKVVTISISFLYIIGALETIERSKSANAVAFLRNIRPLLRKTSGSATLLMAECMILLYTVESHDLSNNGIDIYSHVVDIVTLLSIISPETWLSLLPLVSTTLKAVLEAVPKVAETLHCSPFVLSLSSQLLQILISENVPNLRAIEVLLALLLPPTSPASSQHIIFLLPPHSYTCRLGKPIDAASMQAVFERYLKGRDFSSATSVAKIVELIPAWAVLCGEMKRTLEGYEGTESEVRRLIGDEWVWVDGVFICSLN